MNSAHIILQSKQMFLQARYELLIHHDSCVYPPLQRDIKEVLISQFAIALSDQYLHATNFNKIDKKTKFPVSILYAIITNLLKANKRELAIKVIQNHFDKQNSDNNHIINYNTAKLYQQLREYKKAAFYLENVLKEQPFFKEAVYDLCEIYIRELKRQEEAISMLERHLGNTQPHSHIVALYIQTHHSFQNAVPLLSRLNNKILNLTNYYNLALYLRLNSDNRAKSIFAQIIQKLQEREEKGMIRLQKDYKLLILSKVNLYLIFQRQQNTSSYHQNSSAQPSQIAFPPKYAQMSLSQLAKSIIDKHGDQLDRSALNRLQKGMTSGLSQIKSIKMDRRQQKSSLQEDSMKQNEKYSSFNDEYMNLRSNNNKKLKFLLMKEKELNAFFNNIKIKKQNLQQYKFVVKLSKEASNKIIKNAKNDLNKHDYLLFEQHFNQITHNTTHQSLTETIQQIINNLPAASQLAQKMITQPQEVNKRNARPQQKSCWQGFSGPEGGYNSEKKKISKAKKKDEISKLAVSLQKNGYALKQEDPVIQRCKTKEKEGISCEKSILKTSSSGKFHNKTSFIATSIPQAKCNLPKISQSTVLKSERSDRNFRIKFHQSKNSEKQTKRISGFKQGKQNNKTEGQVNESQVNVCLDSQKEVLQQKQEVQQKQVPQQQQVLQQKEILEQKDVKESLKQIIQHPYDNSANKLSSKGIIQTKAVLIVQNDNKQSQCEIQLQRKSNEEQQIQCIVTAANVSKAEVNGSKAEVQCSVVLLQGSVDEMKSSIGEMPCRLARIPVSVDEVIQNKDKANQLAIESGNKLSRQKIQLQSQSKLSIKLIKQKPESPLFDLFNVFKAQSKAPSTKKQPKKPKINKPVQSFQPFQKSLKIIEQKVISGYKKQQEKILSKRLVEEQINLKQKSERNFDPYQSTFQLTGFDKNSFGLFLKENAKTIAPEQLSQNQLKKTLKNLEKERRLSRKMQQILNNEDPLKEQLKIQLQKCHQLQKDQKYKQAFELYNVLYKHYKKDSEKQQILLGIGDLFASQERYDEAEKTYNKCAKYNSAEAFLRLGEIQLKNNKIQLGVENIEKANCIKRNNSDIESKLVYGYSLREDTMEKALALAQNILKKEPESLEILIMTAKILQNQGKVKEAIEIVHAIDSFQQTQYIKYYLGILYLIDSNLTEAFKNFKAALALKPDYIPALIEIATIISEISPKQSIAILIQVLQYEPGNRKALARLGKIYQSHENDFENAMMTYRTALEYQPNYESYMKVGDCLAKKQSFIEALLNYKEALMLKKTHEAYYKIGLMLSIKNQHQKAIQNFQIALNIGQKQDAMLCYETRRQYLKNLGKLYIKVSSFDQSIKAFEKMLQHEQSSQIYKLLGDAYYGKKEYQMALDNYARSNDLAQQQDMQILENIAVCFDKLQEYLASKEIYEKILQKHPANIKCLNNLANVQLIIGQTNEAFYNFENLLYYLPKNVQKRLKIADIYAQVGDWSKVEYHLLQCYKIKQNDERVLQRLINLYKEKRDYKMVAKYEKKRGLVKHSNKAKLNS